jgi:hypothetical protein
MAVCILLTAIFQCSGTTAQQQQRPIVLFVRICWTNAMVARRVDGKSGAAIIQYARPGPNPLVARLWVTKVAARFQYSASQTRWSTVVNAILVSSFLFTDIRLRTQSSKPALLFPTYVTKEPYSNRDGVGSFEININGSIHRLHCIQK